MTSSNPPYPYYNGIEYNSSFFTSNTGSGLTQAKANALYLQKTTTDTATALETFNSGIKTDNIGAITTTSSIYTDLTTSNTLNIGQGTYECNVGNSSSTTSVGESGSTVRIGNAMTNGLLQMGTGLSTSNTRIAIGSKNVVPSTANNILIGASGNTTTLASTDTFINLLNTNTINPTTSGGTIQIGHIATNTNVEIASQVGRLSVLHLGDGNSSSGAIHIGNGVGSTNAINIGNGAGSNNNINILTGIYTSGQTVGTVNILSGTYAAGSFGGNCNLFTTARGTLTIGGVANANILFNKQTQFAYGIYCNTVDAIAPTSNMTIGSILNATGSLSLGSTSSVINLYGKVNIGAGASTNTPYLLNITRDVDEPSYPLGASLMLGNNANNPASNSKYRLYLASGDLVHSIYSTGSYGDSTHFCEVGGWNFRKTFPDITGNVVASISPTGVYTQVSDVDKKKDFEPSTLGLIEILQLKPTMFRYKTEEDDAPKSLGFIAQEVKHIIPQAYVEKEEFIGLNFNAIISVLCKAVQDMKQDYETKILKLEERIMALL